MIHRKISEKALNLAKKFPVLAIVGPRQSGKTTLAKALFPEYPYVNLEELETRQFASSDPKGFLQQYQAGAVLDEIQRVPELLSYMQTLVDERNLPGQFILTGSHNYLLLQHVTQSLAGRVAFLTLLPLSLEEVLFAGYSLQRTEQYIFQGWYPRLYDQQITPTDWYPNYIQSYIERDVRLIRNIPDLAAFQNFIKLCAGRCGQILNLSTLANDIGITHNTAKAWISVLESSYILYRLPPYYSNLNKRIIKAPKLYFYDTGLACALLGIRTPEQLFSHYNYGALFENFVIGEIMKYRLNRGYRSTDIYYWRDSTGHEIDCVIDLGNIVLPIEIKSGKTIVPDYFKNLRYWKQLTTHKSTTHFVIYGGDQVQQRQDGLVVPWHNLTTLYQQLV